LRQIHEDFIPQIGESDFLLIAAHKRVRINQRLKLKKTGKSPAQLSLPRGVCIRYDFAALRPQIRLFVRLP
jgi:hypothetical protein